MLKGRSFNTVDVPRMTDVFPQAVITDSFIFLSGTTGLDPHSGLVISDDFEEQTRQALNNIKTILEAAGSSVDKIVKTTLYMVTGNDFAIVNKVYKEFFPSNAPARSTPQVMPFPGGILMSIECIALK